LPPLIPFPVTTSATNSGEFVHAFFSIFVPQSFALFIHFSIHLFFIISSTLLHLFQQLCFKTVFNHFIHFIRFLSQHSNGTQNVQPTIAFALVGVAKFAKNGHGMKVD
jgi:hypothetical protein